MRHGKKGNHLGRNAAHRKALLSNLATALIVHKRITTTLAKAKALRVYIEPLITKAKVDSTTNRRTIFAYLGQKEEISELYRVVAMKVADRPGGYTRIIKLGHRLGDGAKTALIELVDFNETIQLSSTNTATNTNPEVKKTTRRSSGNRKKVNDAVSVEQA